MPGWVQTRSAEGAGRSRGRYVTSTWPATPVTATAPPRVAGREWRGGGEGGRGCCWSCRAGRAEGTCTGWESSPRRDVHWCVGELRMTVNMRRGRNDTRRRPAHVHDVRLTLRRGQGPAGTNWVGWQAALKPTDGRREVCVRATRRPGRHRGCRQAPRTTGHPVGLLGRAGRSRLGDERLHGRWLIRR